MNDKDSMVIIVDDDTSFRRSTERLLRSAGFEIQSYPSALEFLNSARSDAPACLVADVCMPGLSGLELQQELARLQWRIPIIFITGHGDIRTSVRAMKAGAVEFITKPFREQEFLDAVGEAIARDRTDRRQRARTAGLQMRYALLTRREREVMAHVVAGMLNKQVAATLDIKEKTIKFHRGNIMRKMQAGSLAELVRMAGEIDVLKDANPTVPRSS